MAAGFKKATVRSGDVAATLTSYPTYVDLSRLGVTTLAEAESVRVYADSGKTTEWSREIVSVTEMHVKVPSLTSSTEIFVDWDGVRSDYGVTTTYGRNAVWSDYEAVYHLLESGSGVSGEYIDSTGSHNAQGGGGAGTQVPSSVAAKIGNGQEFDGSNDWIDLNEDTAFENGTGAITVSAWAKTNRDSSQNNGGMAIASKQGSSPFPGWALSFSMGTSAADRGKIRFLIDGGSVSVSTQSTTQYNDNVFHFFAGVRNGGTVLVYADGLVKDTSTGASSLNMDAARNAVIGANSVAVSVDQMDGIIDEFRFRKEALSADWLLTEYNNQNAESTFWGTWTDAGGGGGGGAAQTARRGVVMMM